MANKQFYGLTYPFTAQKDEHYFVDLNYDNKERVRSMLMHIIFTPKGQKLRDPEFGTDLIKYIFEPQDGITLDDIKVSVSETVSRYVQGITINNISILQGEDVREEIFVRLDYSVKNGYKTEDDSIVVTL